MQCQQDSRIDFRNFSRITKSEYISCNPINNDEPLSGIVGMANGSIGIIRLPVNNLGDVSSRELKRQPMIHWP